VSPESADAEVPRWGTFANAITFTRVLAAPGLVVALVCDARVAALGLFALAVATDLADGRLARRLGEASRLGGLLDHSADAFFCSVALGALAWAGVVPAPLPFLVAASFLQYALDSRSIAGRPLRASAIGRWNGISYFVLIGIPVVRDALGWSWPGPLGVALLGWLLVASTLVSMADRGWAYATRGSG
jgi:phosphatidylglycerophosphate synthase